MNETVTLEDRRERRYDEDRETQGDRRRRRYDEDEDYSSDYYPDEDSFDGRNRGRRERGSAAAGRRRRETDSISSASASRRGRERERAITAAEEREARWRERGTGRKNGQVAQVPAPEPLPEAQAAAVLEHVEESLHSNSDHVGALDRAANFLRNLLPGAAPGRRAGGPPMARPRPPGSSHSHGRTPVPGTSRARTPPPPPTVSSHYRERTPVPGTSRAMTPPPPGVSRPQSSAPPSYRSGGGNSDQRRREERGESGSDWRGGRYSERSRSRKRDRRGEDHRERRREPRGGSEDHRGRRRERRGGSRRSSSYSRRSSSYSHRREGRRELRDDEPQTHFKGVPNPWKLGADHYCYVKSLALTVNGMYLLHIPRSPSRVAKKLYLGRPYEFLDAEKETSNTIFTSHMEFMHFLVASNKMNKINANNITADMYHRNCSIWGTYVKKTVSAKESIDYNFFLPLTAFDMRNADVGGTANGNIINSAVQSSQLRVDIRFSQTTPCGLKLLVFAIGNQCLAVKENGSIGASFDQSIN